MDHPCVAIAAVADHHHSVVSSSLISDSRREDQKKKKKTVSDCVSPRLNKMPEENVKRVSTQKKKTPDQSDVMMGKGKGACRVGQGWKVD
jgi:hypothetical protein